MENGWRENGDGQPPTIQVTICYVTIPTTGESQLMVWYGTGHSTYIRIYNDSYRGCIPTYGWLLLPWLHPATTLTAPPCQADWALLARSEQHVQLSLWWSRSRRGAVLSLSKVRRTGNGHRALGPSLQLDLTLKPTHGPWLFSSLSRARTLWSMCWEQIH